MEQLLKLVNVELTAKLAISALLASAVIVTGANAIDTGIETEDRTHLEHKLWLEENATTDNDDQYESSQQAETARHANNVIAKAYGRQS